MKISSFLSIGLLALLTPLTAAWDKDDHEIFRLRDEVAAYEGPDVSFYDFLGVTPSASQDEISRAYRKRSKALHPDKVRQQLQAKRASQNKAKAKKGVAATKAPTQAEIKTAVKEAADRQARLGVVAEILRGSGRARYDHFIKNGFPVWKGTGYYYNRYRPGLGTVLVGCLIVGGGGFHYIALYMGWRRQQEFVERYIKFARQAAWGDNLGIPGVDNTATATPPPPPPADEEQAPMMATNRKQRRMQEREARKETAKESRRTTVRGRAGKSGSGSATPVPQTQPGDGSGPTGAKKRVVAENGKVLVVDSLGDVYLEQEDEEGNVHEFLLDPKELPKPTVRDTALYKLPIWAYTSVTSRIFGKKHGAEEDADNEAEEAVDELIDDDSDAPQRTPSSTDSNDDFELLDTTKSVEDLAKKATGSQSQSGGKAKKRNKKR